MDSTGRIRTICLHTNRHGPWDKYDSALNSRYITNEIPDLGGLHDFGTPIQIYPLYENAFRAHRGQSLKANNEESAKLYAEFSKVASKNEVAWSHGKFDDEQVIGTVSKKNRMICFPCKCPDCERLVPVLTIDQRSTSHERFQHRESCRSLRNDIHYTGS